MDRNDGTETSRKKIDFERFHGFITRIHTCSNLTNVFNFRFLKLDQIGSFEELNRRNTVVIFHGYLNKIEVDLVGN